MLTAALGAPALSMLVLLQWSSGRSSAPMAAFVLVPSALAVGAGLFLRRPPTEILIGAVAAVAVCGLGLVIVFVSAAGGVVD